MRIRKKKWVEPFLKLDHPTYIKEPETLINQWQSTFNKGFLHLEIGAGKGDYWLNMARQHPQALWVALEKEETVGAMAIRKAYAFDVDNAFFIIDDASRITEFFGEHEVDIIHLNFSDPWPKKIHWRRRLSSESYIDDYRKILKPDGKIIMKTDNRQLFEYSLVNFNQQRFTLEEVYLDFRDAYYEKINKLDAITEYEQRFIDLEQPINRGIWRKHA